MYVDKSFHYIPKMLKYMPFSTSCKQTLVTYEQFRMQQQHKDVM